VHGQRDITPDTAWLLALALDTTPEFWLKLQLNYDVTASRSDL